MEDRDKESLIYDFVAAAPGGECRGARMALLDCLRLGVKKGHAAGVLSSWEKGKAQCPVPEVL